MVGALIRKGGTWLAGRGARATTKANVGGKFKYVSGSGDSLDDAFKGLPGVKKTAAGDGWRIPQGHMVVDDTGKVLGKGGKSFTKETWKGSFRVVKVNRLNPSVKAARSSSILSKAKSDDLRSKVDETKVLINDILRPKTNFDINLKLKKIDDLLTLISKSNTNDQNKSLKSR